MLVILVELVLIVNQYFNFYITKCHFLYGSVFTLSISIQEQRGSAKQKKDRTERDSFWSVALLLKDFNQMYTL